MLVILAILSVQTQSLSVKTKQCTMLWTWENSDVENQWSSAFTIFHRLTKD